MVWLGLGFWAANVSLPREAQAADSADAYAKHGVELRRERKDREALQEFQRAYAVRRSAHFLAQIALAEQALGMWEVAHDHLRVALADTADSWIVKNRASLEKARAAIQSHLATIEVWGEPAGAQVLLNQRVVGTLPLPEPVRVTEGTIVVTVRAAGHATSTRSLSLAAGTLRREQFVLQRLEAPPALATGQAGETRPISLAAREPETGRREETLIRSSERAEEADTADESSSPLYTRWWFWSAVGVVAVGAAVGGYLVLKKDPAGPVCPAMDGGKCSPWP